MPRRRRSTQFEDTLAAAESLLQRRIQEREKAQATLSALAVEIPNLERTIRALHAQIAGKEVMPSESRDGLQLPSVLINDTRVVTGDHRAETSDIPPEVLATLPPDYLQPYTMPEEDNLPPIEGTDLLEKK